MGKLKTLKGMHSVSKTSPLADVGTQLDLMSEYGTPDVIRRIENTERPPRFALYRGPFANFAILQREKWPAPSAAWSDAANFNKP